jgi:hypothetical protein
LGASRQLAQALLAREIGAENDVNAVDLANAGIRVINRLYPNLKLLISERGFAAVLARAPYLAARTDPLLTGIEAGSVADDDPLPGLRAFATGRDAKTVREATLAILANFVAVFKRLVGRDLGVRYINDASSSGDPEDLPAP